MYTHAYKHCTLSTKSLCSDAKICLFNKKRFVMCSDVKTCLFNKKMLYDLFLTLKCVCITKTYPRQHADHGLHLIPSNRITHKRQ